MRFPAFFLLAVFTSSALCDSIGVVGPVYPIEERDLLKVFEENLKEKEKSGELARLQTEAKKRVLNSIEHPNPIAGITRAQKSKTFYYDPSITADKTYTDPNGRIIVIAGTKVNPLDFINMSKHLVFFDARDPEQKAKAKELYELYQGRVKLVLTGGSYTELMREWAKDEIRIYYDQKGVLVNKFSIRHVPAIVSQEGKRLRIDEIAL